MSIYHKRRNLWLKTLEPLAAELRIRMHVQKKSVYRRIEILGGVSPGILRFIRGIIKSFNNALPPDFSDVGTHGIRIVRVPRGASLQGALPLKN